MRIPEVYRTIDAPAVLSSLPGYKYPPAPPKKPSGARSDYCRIRPLSELCGFSANIMLSSMAAP